MARKTLLTEAEVRKFMKLANIKPLAEMGTNFSPNPRNEEDLYEEEEEVEVGEEEEEGLPPDVDMAADVGPDDMDLEPDMDLGDEVEMGAPPLEKEDEFKDIVQQLADLVGVEVDLGAEDELGNGPRRASS